MGDGERRKDASQQRVDTADLSASAPSTHLDQANVTYISQGHPNLPRRRRLLGFFFSGSVHDW